MKRLLWVLIVSTSLILSIITACTSSRKGEGKEQNIITPSPIPSATATLPPLTLEDGKGGAKGTLVSYPESWKGSELHVYFAPFYPGSQKDEGIVVLEPSIHPSTKVRSGGFFQLGNIPPGRYVVVIGPNPEDALPIGGNDHPKILEISEGKVLAIGEVDLGN